MQIAAREIVLWTTPSEPPKALQASECSELLDPMRSDATSLFGASSWRVWIREVLVERGVRFLF